MKKLLWLLVFIAKDLTISTVLSLLVEREFCLLSSSSACKRSTHVLSQLLPVASNRATCLPELLTWSVTTASRMLPVSRLKKREKKHAKFQWLFSPDDRNLCWKGFAGRWTIQLRDLLSSWRQGHWTAQVIPGHATWRTTCHMLTLPRPWCIVGTQGSPSLAICTAKHVAPLWTKSVLYVQLVRDEKRGNTQPRTHENVRFFFRPGPILKNPVSMMNE